MNKSKKRKPNNYITHQEIEELKKDLYKTVCHHCR